MQRSYKDIILDTVKNMGYLAPVNIKINH